MRATILALASIWSGTLCWRFFEPGRLSIEPEPWRIVGLAHGNILPDSVQATPAEVLGLAYMGHDLAVVDAGEDMHDLISHSPFSTGASYANRQAKLSGATNPISSPSRRPAAAAGDSPGLG